jgi:hypothetical protein
MNTSVKRVSKAKLQQTIEDSVVEGWNLKSQNENIAILTKPGTWGSMGAHFLVFIFTAWWSFFLGNAVYAVYAYLTTRSELQIKADLEE